MSPARTIQNFRGFRGVWWGPAGHHAEVLRAALCRLGVATTTLDEAGAGLNPERDVLFVDADGVFDPAPVAQPVPVVGVLGVAAPSRLKALGDVGATAFLHKPIHPATVYSSLYLAVNNHARFARLQAEIEEHNRRRAGRRYITRAIIALMQDRGMTDEQAYAQLRCESMARRIGVEAAARLVCDDIDAFMTFPQQEASIARQDDAVCDRGPGRLSLADPGSEPRRRSNQARRA